MAMRHDLPAEELRSLLRLDPETGRVFWLQRGPECFKEGVRQANACAIWNARYANREAMTARLASGYRVGAVFNRLIRRSHAVFALHHGRWPIDHVDHIDGDIENDRPSNLRDATHSQNMQNRIGNRVSRSRFKGLAWLPKRNRWIVRCATEYCGVYLCEEEAARAYDRRATAMFGEFARLNFPPCQ